MVKKFTIILAMLCFSTQLFAAETEKDEKKAQLESIKQEQPALGEIYNIKKTKLGKDYQKRLSEIKEMEDEEAVQKARQKVKLEYRAARKASLDDYRGKSQELRNRELKIKGRLSRTEITQKRIEKKQKADFRKKLKEQNALLSRDARTRPAAGANDRLGQGRAVIKTSSGRATRDPEKAKKRKHTWDGKTISRHRGKF